MKSPKDIAIQAAKTASEIILEFASQDIKYSLKNPLDIQAEADVATEKIIIDIIQKAFPDHSIFSEEAGELNQNSEYLWVIDPIDGTINFSRHIEEFCASIALCHKGEIILGVIYQPITKKLYVAEKGVGAFLNNQQIHVSKESNLMNSILGTDNTSKPEARARTFAILASICANVRQTRIFGSSALMVARLAEGKVDSYYKAQCNFWDYAAVTLLVEEAGGKVTDFEGKPISQTSKTIAASNGILHNELLRLIHQ